MYIYEVYFRSSDLATDDDLVTVMSSSAFMICVVVVSVYIARVSGASTNGFSSLEQLSDDGLTRQLVGLDVRQWVFPAIRFTCDGYVTKWIFRATNETTGRIDDSDRPPFLPLMETRRETEAIVGPSNEYLLIRTSGSEQELQGSGPVYEYVLQSPVEVRENDIFGIRTLYPDDTDGTWRLRLEMLEVAEGTAPTSYPKIYPEEFFDTDFETSPNNNLIPLVTAVISVPGGTSSSLVLVPTVTAAVPSSIPGRTSSSLVLLPTVTTTVPSTPTPSATYSLLSSTPLSTPQPSGEHHPDNTIGEVTASSWSSPTPSPAPHSPHHNTGVVIGAIVGAFCVGVITVLVAIPILLYAVWRTRALNQKRHPAAEAVGKEDSMIDNAAYLEYKYGTDLEVKDNPAYGLHRAAVNLAADNDYVLMAPAVLQLPSTDTRKEQSDNDYELMAPAVLQLPSTDTRKEQSDNDYELMVPAVLQLPSTDTRKEQSEADGDSAYEAIPL